MGIEFLNETEYTDAFLIEAVKKIIEDFKNGYVPMCENKDHPIALEQLLHRFEKKKSEKSYEIFNQNGELIKKVNAEQIEFINNHAVLVRRDAYSWNGFISTKVSVIGTHHTCVEVQN